MWVSPHPHISKEIQHASDRNPDPQSETRNHAERMKMRTAHIIPLSRQAVAVLEELRL